MKGFGWLDKLRRNEGGNALAIAAATMPLMLGAAGLAVDTIQLSVRKRQLQRAADSAAVAGVYGLTQGDGQAIHATEAVHSDLEQNRFPTLTQQESVTVGPLGTFDRTVSVELVSSRTLPFMSIFTSAPSAIRARASAALVNEGTFCVLSLYDGTQTGVDVGGNADIDLGCGVASNSRATQAVTAGGSSELNASPIMAVGGLNGANNNFSDGTQLQPNSSAQRDPFAGVPDPAPCTPSSALSVGPQDTVTLPTGNHCFSSADIKGTLNIGEGSTITIYGGNLQFGSQANVTAARTAWLLTGPGGAAGDFGMNAQATLNLTAPRSGPYSSILFYRDRRADSTEITINGGADATLEGAFYFPTSNVRVNGNAEFEVRCFQLVGQILTFRGTAEIHNTCDAGGDSGFQMQYVRLIR